MSFAEELKKLKAAKPLKTLEADTPLPYVFDLHWDAKTVAGLVRMNLLKNPEVQRLLAENGFDVKSILK